MTDLEALLEKHDACDDARKWCAPYESPSAAWMACQNPGWLMWALDALGLWDDRKGRLFACWCARQVWDVMPDSAKVAVEVAERFAEGSATQEELSAARSAAWSATLSATMSAAWSAALSATMSATMSAAWSATMSAAWSDVWLATMSAAESAARSAQCGKIREMFGNPFATH